MNLFKGVCAPSTFAFDRITIASDVPRGPPVCMGGIWTSSLQMCHYSRYKPGNRLITQCSIIISMFLPIRLCDSYYVPSCFYSMLEPATEFSSCCPTNTPWSAQFPYDHNDWDHLTESCPTMLMACIRARRQRRFLPFWRHCHSRTIFTLRMAPSTPSMRYLCVIYHSFASHNMVSGSPVSVDESPGYLSVYGVTFFPPDR